jgi:hypothetical protein
MSFTVKNARELGWAFDVNGEEGIASKDGEEMFQVASGVPLFSMLNEVAVREGFAPLEASPVSIKAATGETYSPPEFDPELTLEALRTRRDELLEASNWTQLADSPLSDADRKSWAEYRQELRDLLEAKTLDPFHPPPWPTPPA